MKKDQCRLMMACLVAVTAGCGAVPNVLIDAAKQSAKEAVEERINELVDEVADELIDPDQLGELLPDLENE